MKRLFLLFLFVLLSGCDALMGEPRFFIRIEPLQPVLVLTYVEGLEPSLQTFFKHPFEVVDSLDGVSFSDYKQVLVLYDDNLFQTYPPSLFGSPQLEYSKLMTYGHPSGVDITVVYLDGVDEYIEMFELLDPRIFQTRDSQIVYQLYPLNGMAVRVESRSLNSELLLQGLSSQATLAPSGNMRWFYTSEELYLFLDDSIPSYLSDYADQLEELQEEAVVIVNKRGQRLVIGRAVGPNAAMYYESFIEQVSRGVEGLRAMSLSPPISRSSLEVQSFPVEVCYTKDLRDQLFGVQAYPTTVSHQIPVERLSSVGHHVGLVVMVQFELIAPRLSDQEYLNIIQQAHRFTDAYYNEMSEGQLTFEWRYHSEVVTAPFFLNPNIKPGMPGFMEGINEHVDNILKQVETSVDLSDVDFVSIFWPLGLPDFVIGGLAEQRSERLNTQNGTIYNYVIQRLDTNPMRLAYVVTHEMAHNLGLTDTYIHHWAPGQRNTVPKYGHWDLMAANNELSAWHRWTLSWMPDEQVHCLPHGNQIEYEVFLEPLNNRDATTRQIVISLSETQAISIELRGRGRFCPSGCDQNVLVTFIDTMVGDGHGPIQILRPPRSTRRDYSDALLLEGEFVTFRNITITHQDRTAEGSVILIRFD